jgi:putative Holliday junction resolvase
VVFFSTRESLHTTHSKSTGCFWLLVIYHIPSPYYLTYLSSSSTGVMYLFQIIFVLLYLVIMGRILGIDYGKKRIGLAVTDPLKIFASPLITIKPEDFDNFIGDYLRTEEVDAFVIGYPVNLNNHPSESVNYINPFIRKLRKTFPGITIHLADERFTSQMAYKTMIDGGVKKKDRQNKGMIDKISASIILQSFLESRSYKEEKDKLK